MRKLCTLQAWRHWSQAAFRGSAASQRAYPFPNPSIRGRWTTKQTTSFVVLNKYASEYFMRGGSLTKLFALVWQGIIGQWLPLEKGLPREGPIRFRLPR